MREIVFILILIFTGYGCSLVSAVTDSEWLDWKLKHNKDYDSQEEELSRRQIWINNYKLIEEHNKGDHTFKLALNHLADLVRFISYHVILRSSYFNGSSYIINNIYTYVICIILISTD